MSILKFNIRGSILPEFILNCIYKKQKPKDEKPGKGFIVKLKTHYQLFIKFLPYLWYLFIKI
jgi:hypothetical protein